MLQKFYLNNIWYPIFCKQYLEKTFNLRRAEYCILQKIYEFLGIDNINWLNCTYNSSLNTYLVICEYIDPIYNTVIKAHFEFNARDFNRTFEE